MHHAAEHDMGHARKLFGGCCMNMRVVVAVARCPPSGHAIDQRAAIRQRYAATLCGNAGQGRRGGLHLAVG